MHFQKVVKYSLLPYRCDEFKSAPSLIQLIKIRHRIPEQENFYKIDL